MHIPEIFSENDAGEIQRLIEAHPLALVTYATSGGVYAQHVPLIFDGQHRLIGHFAANNEICSQLQSGAQVLAVFSGQDSYVSPNWYPTKQQHHRHVPTWNYQAVHIRGSINFLAEPKAALGVVGKLTKHFEHQSNGSKACKMADAPREFIDELLAQITPFEILVDEVEAKSKLSQNRDLEDFDSVADELERRGQREFGARMAKLRATD